MVLKRDIKITDDEIEAETEDYYLYEWDPDIDKKIYRIPKFREKIEKELKKYETNLSELNAEKNNHEFNKKKAKYKKKLNEMLSKPNEWYTKIMNDFTEKIEKISPFFDYLDTDERKIIEHFEERISEYSKVLDDLMSRAEFNL
jgi:phage shock protein A